MGEVKDKDGNTVGYFTDKEVAKVGEVFKANRRYPATPEDLIRFADDFFDVCVATAARKNADYSGASDIFKNFRMGGEFGFAVRMSDKVSRLNTLLYPGSGAAKVDETVEETCHDLANYAMLLAAFRASERSGR